MRERSYLIGVDPWGRNTFPLLVDPQEHHANDALLYRI